MRPIDADELQKEGYLKLFDKKCTERDLAFLNMMVEKMPTIDAIPVEWIENFIDDIGDLEEEMTMRAVYSLLINEWRNERKEE